ncbi:MAG: alpha/beta hydrolase [Anaerolineales bacterium]
MKNKKILIVILGILVVIVLFLIGLVLILNTENKDLDDAARDDAPGEFVLLSAGWVHYQMDGPPDSPLVVFVHGFSVPSYIWDPTCQALVNEGYQVLSFDLYGRGYSDRPERVYDINLFYVQLKELLDKLEINSPVHLVGLSMGGPIVARYGYTHPDLVSSITLVAPEVVQTPNNDIFPMNLNGVGEYLMRAVMEPVVLPKLQSGDFYQPDKFPGWIDLYRVQLQYHGTGRALLSTIRQLVKLNPEMEYQELSQTKLPVLLIWGSKDQTISEEHIQVLRELLPEMEVLIVERAGHIPHYERPEIVNPLLIDFLSTIP